MSNQLTDAINERDRILIDLDVHAAKAFITKHGGKVPNRRLDWIKVLHLARLEVTTIPNDLLWDSRIYLAQHGADQVMTLRPSSPYLHAAMDLIFPKALFEAHMKAAQP